ncbi:hypothetical protein [Pacificibacter marinus]|uniref:Uncharacterized protein n=1 Tax=Pacificibacter marinus TaxID=658057 RepID=A0A1Y5TD39_9RHOB|nr:hypothetical protein [Pacificibacter marinus]SEL08296.1 hypothetical protein SAMN04488032_11137 [Pacificibacter marinus]SLN57703.1 hypothetical protein PAM7971_02992 [Pacificibacter marinus]
MPRNFALYGTNQPPMESQVFSIGDLSFSYENGAIRHVKLDTLEAIRNIAFVVRDRDWGTLAPVMSDEVILQTETDLHLSYHARYGNQGATLDVDIDIHASTNGLKMSVTGHASGAFETNRTGFTVLHPIEHVAGCPVRVGHSDGTVESAQFPALIEPWQPFMDITSLAHHVGGHVVTCQFKGDTFEMEDQRQWGDASYKTYNRPLAKPWPYKIENGASVTQSVEITWKMSGSAVELDAPAPHENAIFPQMALVITPNDARHLATNPTDLSHVNPQRLLCHLDTDIGATSDQFQAFAQAQNACPDVAFDLELICQCDADPAPELMALAVQMAETGFAPASVLICPSVDRGSTPPGSQWPPCPPLDLVHSAAAKAFPNISRGGGVVSFFPELNRKRPPIDQLDFISHGLCPIVHAADDLSVMETLEAIPHITRTARDIIGARAYRIGPASIAMRQNPYGDRTIPNPEGLRVCMADDDPRHRGQFGAAYVVGLACALAPADIAIWTPAALYGPRGVVTDGQKTGPITDALKQLAALAGQPVKIAKREGGGAYLCVGDTDLTANLMPMSKDGFGPFEWRFSRKSD